MIKKLLILFLLVCVIGVVAIGWFFSSIVNKTVVTAVETVGPEITQTPVTLDSFNLSLLSGSGSMNGVFLGNPKGYTSDKAFYLGQVEVQVEPSSLLSDKIHIKRIYIGQPEFSFEQKLTGNNLNEIRKNIEAFSGQSGASEQKEQPASTEEETADSGEKKKVQIDEFIVEGGKIDVVLLGQKLAVELPRIELNDIGKGESGIGVVDATDIVMTKLIEAIVSAASGVAEDAMKDPLGAGKDLKDKAEGVIGGLKKLF